MGKKAWILKHEDGNIITNEGTLEQVSELLGEMEVGRTVVVERTT